MKYSVLVDLSKLKNPYSGLGQVALHYGKALCKAGDNSLRLSFLIPRGFASQFDGDVDFEYLSLKRRYAPFLCQRYDLWHALHQDSAYLPTDLSSPYILTINDLNFLEEKSPGKAARRLRRLQKKVYRAAAITVISQFTEEAVRKNLEIPNMPLEVIHYGAEYKGASQSQKPSFMPDGDFLFTIGVIKRKKNFEVLVDFMNRLGGYRLVIAGNNSDRYAGEIRDKINHLNLQGRIILPGRITDSEKFWLYEHCRAFLFPSKLEGFGLPVVEAMHYGKPVFLSTCTSLPEIGGDLAYYWHNFDAQYMKDLFLEKMDDFYRNGEKAGSMKAYARNFTWSKNVRSYISLYKRILMEGKPMSGG